MTTRQFGAMEARPTEGSVTEQAAEVASTAGDAAGPLAQEAGEQLRQVGDAVREQVSEITGELGTQGRHVVEDAKHQLHEQAQTQTENLAEALRRIGDQINDMLSGRPPQEGPVRDYGEQLASKVTEVAGRVHQRGFDGIVNDAERFARRRPGIFLLGAAAAGVVAGRVLRGTKSEQNGQGGAPLPPIGAAASGDGPAQNAPAPAVAAPSDTTLVPPPAPPILPSASTPKGLQ